MKQRHVVIVGGGAAGLVAAISAARNHARVTIIEQQNKLGKKILSTGNGRCNLTNEKMSSEFYRGENIAIVDTVLRQFGYKETIDFFESLGVLMKNRQGYIYPISDQASTIVEALTMEIQRLGIQVLLEQSVNGIEKDKRGFKVGTNGGTIRSDVVILATGGKASPVLGSDGSGYTLCKTFGHTISPVVPALVQLKGNGQYFKHVAGVRTNANILLYVDGNLIASDIGELQLTNYGISGIPVFQISRFAAKAIYEKKPVHVELDFFPTMNELEFQEFMTCRKNKFNERTGEQFFIGLCNQKLIGMFLKQAQIPLHIKVSEIREEKWIRLLTLCKHFQVEIEDTNSFEQAQICAGGVRTSEIDPKTLESIYENDLYITGELMDIDGICGGYNLQWAWSTGYLAGKNAAKGLQ